MFRTQEAEKYFAQLVQADPNNFRYLEKYAGNFYRAKKYDQSDKYFQKCLKLKPDYYETYKFYAKSLQDRKKYLKAEDIYERGIKYDPKKLLRCYGQFLQRRQKLQEAEKCYMKAVQLDQNDIKAQYRYAKLLYKTEKLVQAQRQFRKIINIKSLDQQNKLSTFADLLYLLNKKEEAEKYYKLSIDVNDDWRSFHNYGLFLLSQRRNQEAEYNIKKSIEKCRDDKKFSLHCSHTSWGRALRKMHKYEQSEEHFKKAIEYNDINQYAHVYYGKLLLDLKRIDEAEQHYLLAIKQDESPRYPINLSVIAEFYIKIQKYEEAIKYLKNLSELFKHKSSSKIMRQNYYTEVEIKHMEYVLHQLLPLYDKINQIKNFEEYKDDSSKAQQTKSMQQDFFSILKASLKTQENNDQEVKVSKKKFDELSAMVQEHTKMINKLNQQVFYAQGLTQILDKNKYLNRMAVYYYGQNLSWILCSTITSYRAIQLGTVSSGSNIVETETTGFLGKVKSVFGVAAKFPGVQTVSSIISSMVGYIIGESQNIAVSKIVTCTKGLFPEQQLSKAVCQTVVFLLKDEEHLKILQTPEKIAWYDQIMDKVGEKKDEIISKMTGIKDLKNDDSQAIADCSFLLTQILKSTKVQEDNPFMQGAKTLLSEKKKALSHTKKSSSKKEKQSSYNKNQQSDSTPSMRSSQANQRGRSSYGEKSDDCVCKVM